VFTGSGWKSHFGGADLQVVPLTDELKRWADLAALSHGGSDMLAVDAVVDCDGNKFIIEVNGTAIGIQPVPAAVLGVGQPAHRIACSAPHERAAGAAA
jgi:hypothetical protein